MTYDSKSHQVAVSGTLLAAAGVAVALAAYIYPDAFGDRYSSDEERAGYIAEIDALCGDVRQFQESHGWGSSEPPTAADYRALAEVMDTAHSEWGEVPLPDPNDRELIAPAFDAWETATLAVYAEARLLEEGARAAALAREGERVGQALDEFRAAARAYGLDTCARLARG